MVKKKPATKKSTKAAEMATSSDVTEKKGQGRPETQETKDARKAIKDRFDFTKETEPDGYVEELSKKGIQWDRTKVRNLMIRMEIAKRQKRKKGGQKSSTKAKSGRPPKNQKKATAAPDNLEVFVAAADFIELMGGVDRAIAVLTAAKRLQR